MRLALTTRSDPPFPLGRMRARGQLLEIRAADLRFSDTEAAGLLNGALGLTLADEQIARLQLRTEGWAAGLQLAGLSLRGRSLPEAFIEEFAGDDRQLVDYLGAEVLQSQPPARRAFLRRTAILNRMCAPLCEALTGDANAAEMLADVERENLFVIALDSTRRWYRYHHLFGDLLRHDLEAAEPGVVTELHARAASWFADQGMAADAIHHAVSAGDTGMAAELVATNWSSAFNRGRHITVARWLAQLPAEAISADSRLWLASVWTSMDRGRIDEVEPLLADDAAPADQAGAWLPVLRALHRFKVGDVGASLEAATGARRRAGRTGVPADRRPPCGGRRRVLARRSDDRRRRAARGVFGAIADHNGLATLYSGGYLALLALDLGDLRGAQAEFVEGDALTARAGARRALRRDHAPPRGRAARPPTGGHGGPVSNSSALWRWRAAVRPWSSWPPRSWRRPTRRAPPSEGSSRTRRAPRREGLIDAAPDPARLEASRGAQRWRAGAELQAGRRRPTSSASASSRYCGCFRPSSASARSGTRSTSR